MNRILKVIMLPLIVSNLFGQGKKIFISADLEGVVGVVTGEQLGPSGFEYNRFRAFMTADVTAAIQARSAERRVGKECRSRLSPYH